MFDLALKAGIPLVRVETTDILNYMYVIEHIVGDGESVSKVAGIKDLDNKSKYLVWYAPKMLSFKSVYSKFMDEDRVLILVNPEKDHPLMFDAGVLATPKALIEQELLNLGFTERQTKNLLPALSGMNLIQVGEICRLAMAKYGEISAQAANSVKMMVSDPTGLVDVDSKQVFYLPDPRLEMFIDEDGWFFIEGEDSRLRPRGMLLHGMSGTGKSQAGRYIASNWKVPLYLMDLSSIMNKYVGQSEHNMRTMLSQTDAEAPCVLILDEVEKLFSSGSGDNGTTTRLLSQLLWWMAEHTSKVFTLMTSNNISVLPEELYRAGRIDKVYEFGGLTAPEALVFGREYATRFDEVELNYVKGAVPLANENGLISHSAVVESVKHEVKQLLIAGGKTQWEM